MTERLEGAQLQIETLGSIENITKQRIGDVRRQFGGGMTQEAAFQFMKSAFAQREEIEQYRQKAAMSRTLLAESGQNIGWRNELSKIIAESLVTRGGERVAKGERAGVLRAGLEKSQFVASLRYMGISEEKVQGYIDSFMKRLLDINLKPYDTTGETKTPAQMAADVMRELS